MARHGADAKPSSVAAYRAREREEVDDRRRERMERERRLAVALKLATGPKDGPANLIQAAEFLEARGRQHDAEVAGELRRRADAIVEARAIVEAASWCPPE